MGPHTNLYPFSPFTSKDPFNMIQDNKIGGLKKKAKKSRVKKSRVKKSRVKRTSPKKKASRKRR